MNGAGFLPAAGDESLALLLGLLAELQSIALNALGFGLAALLKPKGLNTDFFQFRNALLARLFVLFAQLALEFNGFLVQLLSAL